MSVLHRSIPDFVPRQKAYMYIFLIVFTTLLLYFYSYPLNTKNWAYIRPASNIFNAIRGDKANNSKKPSYLTVYSISSTDATFQQNIQSKTSTSTNDIESMKTKLPLPSKKYSTSVENNRKTESKMASEGLLEWRTSSNATAKLGTTDAGESKLTMYKTLNDLTENRDPKETTGVTNEKFTASKKEITYEKTTKLLNINKNVFTQTKKENTKGEEHKTYTKVSVNRSKVMGTNRAQAEITEETDNAKVTSQSGEQYSKYFNGGSSTQVANVSASSAASEASEIHSDFLVFSENCRIPHIDPMHPSIRNLIHKTPPLDCSKDYERLSWTEGNVLFLNRTAINIRTSGKAATCCYRNVTRIKDGLSDNGIGFGKKCINISNKRNVEYEFIKLECKYENSTVFYIEFHSFIHDKPKVEKRCKKFMSKSSKYSVLIIGVDAVSRMNMHRQLNATASYLLNEMEAIEMFGFNKVGDNTFPNLIPLLLGYDSRELPSVCWKSDDLPLDRCNFLWKKFSAKGYRTFYAEDAPHISSFNYIKKGFFHQPTDYYFRHFILAYENALGRDKRLNCHLCVGSTSETEAVLSWTEKFALKFSNRPYFAFSWINSLTHDFLNMGSSGDHIYKTFFHSLHRKGALHKTIVILMGDHGMRWGDIRNTYVGRLEERLPMLMIILPQSFKQEHTEFAKALQQNAHRLITPFDLHATLQHILDLRREWSFTNTDNIENELADNFTSRAYSLFRPVPESRSCDDAFVDEHWCTCEESLQADITSKAIKDIADFLVKHINKLLKPVSSKCATLELNSISDASLWQPPSEHEGHSIADNIYTVIIHVKPSSAIFEGTVKVSEKEHEKVLLGSISRLNLYRNQSHCVNNAILKLYCYCLN